MTTRPQAKCHPERQHYAREMCRYCYKVWLYANNPKAKAKQLATSRRKWTNNRDRILAKQRERYARLREAECDRAYGYKLRDKFGITLPEYRAMLAAQNNQCAICHTTSGSGKSRLAVDHCHATNALRGLLCNRCNLLLGQIGDNTVLLENAIKYLSRFLAACGVQS